MATETIGKSEYIRTFLTERPKDGIEFSQARLVSALKLNDELAEYFKDRAHIEDTYAKSIAKLSKKHYLSNKSALGTFLPIWEMLQMELSRLAAIHGEYSASIIENVEQPLRSSIPNDKDYSDILKMEEHIHKIAREHDDLENKIQKHKKSAKGEAKVAECVKHKEQNSNEWNQQGSQYFQKFESVDENRLNTIKFVIDVFESLQRAQAEKLIEMTTNTITATETLQVADEIAAFCASHASNVRTLSLPQSQSYSSELINIDNVVPEPSLSNASLKQPGQHSYTSASDSPTPVKKEKKRFFSSLVSIRRKPKSEAHGGHVELGSSSNKSSNRQRSFSNAGSFVDSASLHSINTHSTSDHTNEHGVSKSPSTNNFGSDLVIPISPTSINPPSLRKTSSFNGSVTSALSSQPAPLIVVDSEGFSIPPPDRAAWPLEAANVASDSILEADEMESDAGSLFSNNPRIRVDIKNESVSEEDASQSAVALTRVATLLKEKNSTTPPTSRRLRGRREMRATQLYSVIEQEQGSPINQIESSPVASASSSPFINPFEISQEKIVEEQPVSALKERLPQIDVHIVETVHVISKGGEAERSVIWGEISIAYDGPTESATPICFQISHSSKLEKVESTEYVSLLEGYESGTYKINTQALNQNESVVCIKYQTKLSNDRLPIVVKPMWKCDTDKSRLLIKYQKNEELPILNDVIFYTSVTGDVQNALSIPAGELILSQKKIKWHIGQIEDSSEAVIKAQFTTLEQASAQPIIVRFELRDRLLSDVNVDNGVDALVIWAKVLTTFKTVKVGKYIAEV